MDPVAGEAPSPAIRRATPEDAAELARLRYEFRAAILAPEEPEEAFLGRCETWMAERLGPESAWRCWVAVVPGAIVGTILLQLLEKVPNPVAEPEWHGYVSNLYVVPSHRGHGVGAALLEATLAECAAANVDAALLWPTPRSRSLYERFGFRVRDDLMERRKNYEPTG